MNGRNLHTGHVRTGSYSFSSVHWPKSYMDMASDLVTFTFTFTGCPQSRRGGRVVHRASCVAESYGSTLFTKFDQVHGFR